jgi:hypothetical protein
VTSFDLGSEAQVLARPESSAASFGRRIDDAANRFSEALERHKPFVLAVFSIAFFVLTFYRAFRKLLWFDELFTLYLCRLPNMKTVWQAVTHGTDFNPPLFYLITRISERVLGEGPIAIRLPEILGFWVFCLCLFRFVSLRLSVLSASVSMLFPLVTGAYWYAYEARAHGLVLGFCGVALISWQAAADRERRRTWWLFALGGSLAGALLTHSYAFLIFAPIALGELTRTVSRKRLDWPIWLAIAVSSLGVLASIPLVHRAVSEVGSLYFFSPGPRKFVALYASLLKPAAGVLVGWALLTCAVRIVLRRTERVEQEPGFRPYEVAALCAFAAIPVFEYAAAILVGAPFMSRYGISAVAGIAGLLGAAVWKKPVVAIGTLLLLVGQIGVSALHFASFAYGSVLTEPVSRYNISTSIRDFDERYEWMAAYKDLPVVLLDDLDFMPTAYYAPPNLASRLVYVMVSRPDINGKGAARLRACCNSEPPVVEPADFLSSHEAFLAYGGPRSFYRLDDFVKAGATITREREGHDHFLVLVMRPNAFHSQ